MFVSRMIIRQPVLWIPINEEPKLLKFFLYSYVRTPEYYFNIDCVCTRKTDGPKSIPNLTTSKESYIQFVGLKIFIQKMEESGLDHICSRSALKFCYTHTRSHTYFTTRQWLLQSMVCNFWHIEDDQYIFVK